MFTTIWGIISLAMCFSILSKFLQLKMSQIHVLLSIYTSVVEVLTEDSTFAVPPDMLTFLVFNP